MLEPYTKGLLDQTLAVKIQMSDFVRKMGCPDEKEPETLCLVLVMEEKRLEAELVTEALKWYDFEKEKTANGKPHVETKQKDGGWAGVLTVAR